VEILRGNQAVITRRAAISDVVATTWITAAELYFGAAKSLAPNENRHLVGAFLGTVMCMDLNDPAAQRFGAIKADLERAGSAVADADVLIAAIALANDAVLVTGNRKHFARIPGVKIEDWIRP